MIDYCKFNEIILPLIPYTKDDTYDDTYDDTFHKKISSLSFEDIDIGISYLMTQTKMLNLMNLTATIESALDQLPEPNKTAAKNVWNYGTTVERYSQTVLFIQSVTQMTDDQVDEIFQQAEAIVI